jgi:hypothetical protein
LPGLLVPHDDLYARLELEPDASTEAIELAWRALLKRHHPDVAGDDGAALDLAKRINVAHDWLADPSLRARYDRERLGPAFGRGPAARSAATRRPGYPGRTTQRHPAAPRPPRRRSAARPDLVRGDPSERLARFLGRVARLTPDELDRMAAAEPPPIAFLATIRRFVTPEARAAFASVEAALAALVPRERWAEVGLREGLLGVAAELVLSPFLDETLAEPFRSRARERLLRAWEASVDQPRHGPNGAEVAALCTRIAAMTGAEILAFVRASQGIAGGDRPWPAALDRDEDEALRISAVLAAHDAAAAVPTRDVAPVTASRARRLAGRLGHVVALRHGFAPWTYAQLVAPFAAATGERGEAVPGPDVRRAG